MTYTDLLDQIQRGESRLLSCSRVGPCLQMRIIVQVSDGSIWEAFDLFTKGQDEATAWSVRAMQWAYWKGGRIFPDLDSEALFRAVNYRLAAEESYDLAERQRHEHSMGAAAVEAADAIISGRAM